MLRKAKSGLHTVIIFLYGKSSSSADRQNNRVDDAAPFKTSETAIYLNKLENCSYARKYKCFVTEQHSRWHFTHTKKKIEHGISKYKLPKYTYK